MTYLPCEARVTDVSVPVYSEGDRSKPYLSVQCMGSCIYPHLSFDKGDVILQGIPAGELRKSIRRDAEALAILYILGSGT